MRGGGFFYIKKGAKKENCFVYRNDLFIFAPFF